MEAQRGRSYVYRNSKKFRVAGGYYLVGIGDGVGLESITVLTGGEIG